MQMARAGRSRKQGKRERNGRPQRESVGEIMSVVFAQPHRRWLAGKPKLRNKADARSDPKAESQLGILCLSGLIDEALYESGLEYGRLVARMKWSIACPPSAPAAIRLLRTYGESRDPSPEEAARARIEYENARHSILSVSGHTRSWRIMRVVDDVVVRNLQCEDIGLLKEGLTRLCNYF